MTFLILASDSFNECGQEIPGLFYWVKRVTSVTQLITQHSELEYQSQRNLLHVCLSSPRHLEGHCLLFCYLVSSVSSCEGKQRMVAPSQAFSSVHRRAHVRYTHTQTTSFSGNSSCGASFEILTNWLAKSEQFPLWISEDNSHHPAIMSEFLWHMRLCFFLGVALGSRWEEEVSALRWLLLHGWNEHYCY